jgi:hypothetical protein
MPDSTPPPTTGTAKPPAPAAAEGSIFSDPCLATPVLASIAGGAGLGGRGTPIDYSCMRVARRCCMFGGIGDEGGTGGERMGRGAEGGAGAGEVGGIGE